MYFFQVLLSIASAVGVYGYVGVETTLIVFQILPFLVREEERRLMEGCAFFNAQKCAKMRKKLQKLSNFFKRFWRWAWTTSSSW